MKPSLHLLIALLFFVSANSQSGDKDLRIRAVENGLIPYVPVQNFEPWNIEARMKYHKIPGVSIAVIRNFKIDWIKTYGLSDTISKTPVTSQTIFSALVIK